MSAHSAAQRRNWLSALVAQVADYVSEEVEEPAEPEPQALQPHPVVGIVAGAPRSGASTLSRMLAAEMAVRAGGAAVVVGSGARRRSAPPSRAAVRLATALAGVGEAHPVGRLCVVTATATVPPADSAQGVAPETRFRPSVRRDDTRAAETRVRPSVLRDEPRAAETHLRPSVRRDERLAAVVNAARYLAPVVLDLPADGSAAGVAAIADRVVVVAAASDEPALLDAVAAVIGGNPIKVVNRAAELGAWADRAAVVVPDSRIGVRAAALGTRPLGSLGSTISGLADLLEARE